MSGTAATPAAPSAAGPAIRRIAQIALTVGDLARATAFYRDVLGLRFLFDAPPGLAFFDCGGVRLMLSRPEGEEGGGSGTSVLYYDVADIRAAYDTLRAKGVQTVRDPHVIATLGDRDLWMAFVRDSEGNLLGLSSEVPRATTPPSASA